MYYIGAWRRKHPGEKLFCSIPEEDEGGTGGAGGGKQEEKKEEKQEEKKESKQEEKKAVRTADALALEEEKVARQKAEKEREKAQKELDDLKAKQAKESGDFKTLAETREQENVRLRDTLARTAVRPAVHEALVDLGISLKDAKAIAKLIPIDSIKVDDAGNVVGVEDVIANHKKEHERLYELAIESGGVRKGKKEEKEEKKEEKGEKMSGKGEEKEDRSSNGRFRRTTSDIVNSFFPSARTDSGTNSNPRRPEGKEQIVRAVDMSPQEYRALINDLTGQSGRLGRRLRRMERRQPQGQQRQQGQQGQQG